MTGTEDLRGQEYAALMNRARDLERTAQWIWTITAIACAMLLSAAIGVHSAGMMLPVVLCAAFGYRANRFARRRARRIEGYLEEFHETDRSGAQWHVRQRQLDALHGVPAAADWGPLASSNLLSFVSIVLAWTVADLSPRGGVMAGITTMAGIAFSVHSILESIRSTQPANAASWAQLNEPLRETAPAEQRAASGR